VSIGRLSPLQAEVLRTLAVRPMTKSAGMAPSEAERIESIRSQLVNQLGELSTPEST
jgi:hypothetical protein